MTQQRRSVRARRLDLDQLRSVRAEAGENRESPVVVLGGEEFVLPPTISLEVAISLEEGRAATTLRNLIVEADPEQYPRFLEHSPDSEDVKDFYNGLLQLYGVTKGES